MSTESTIQVVHCEVCGNDISAHVTQPLVYWKAAKEMMTDMRAISDKTQSQEIN